MNKHLEDCFERLNIEPTDDLNAIKKAHARQLKNIDRKNNVEEFQSLLNAFRTLEKHFKTQTIGAVEGIEKQFNQVNFDTPPSQSNPLEDALKEKGHAVIEEQTSSTIDLNSEPRETTLIPPREYEPDTSHEALTKLEQELVRDYTVEMDDVDYLTEEKRQASKEEEQRRKETQAEVERIFSTLNEFYNCYITRFNADAWYQTLYDLQSSTRDDDEKNYRKTCLLNFFKTRPFVDRALIQFVYYQFFDDSLRSWEDFLGQLFSFTEGSLEFYYVYNHFYESFWQFPEQQQRALFINVLSTDNPSHSVAAILLLCGLMELELMYSTDAPARREITALLVANPEAVCLSPQFALQFGLIDFASNPTSNPQRWLLKLQNTDSNKDAAKAGLDAHKMLTQIVNGAESLEDQPMSSLTAAPLAVFARAFNFCQVSTYDQSFENYFLEQSRLSHGKIKSQWKRLFESMDCYLQPLLSAHLESRSVMANETQDREQQSSFPAEEQIDLWPQTELLLIKSLAFGDLDEITAVLFNRDEETKVKVLRLLNQVLNNFAFNYRQTSSLMYVLIGNVSKELLLSKLPSQLENSQLEKLAFTAIHTDVLLAYDLLDELEKKHQINPKSLAKIQAKRLFYTSNYQALCDLPATEDEHWEITFYRAIAATYSGEKQALENFLKQHHCDTLTPSYASFDLLEGMATGLMHMMPSARPFAQRMRELTEQ